MNKYNIRAVRKDLDDAIRSGRWKHFRSSFAAVAGNAELCEAIVHCRAKTTKSAARSGGGKSKRDGTLLHSLCRVGNGQTHPVPVDVIRTIASAVPDVLCTQDSSHGRTPLHVAIARGCRLDLVRCLLQMDTTRKSLTIADKNGDTPLLLAARSGDDDYSCKGDVVKLLILHDQSRQTLLTESRKRKRTALFYVAASELSTILDGGEELSEELTFVLMHTHQALKMSTDSPGSRPVSVTEDGDVQHQGTASLCSSGDDITDDEETSQEEDSDAHVVHMLQAAIACAHLGKFASKIFQVILQSDLNRRIVISSSSHPDEYEHGNSMMHHACMATVQRYDCNLSLGGHGHVSLLDFLVEHNSLALGYPNMDGDLPLHLAVRSKKAFEHIVLLASAYPHALRQSNGTGELPLHVAIKQAVDFDSMEVARWLWKLYPEAAEVRDRSTGLFAFQLAACCSFCEGKHGKGAMSLDTINRDRSMNDVPKTSSAATGEEELITSIYTLLLQSPQLPQLFVNV